MIVSKSIEFDTAHRVLTHGGRCRHLHGHHYKVTVYVDGDVPDDGMVLDFGILATVMRERVHDALDHGTVLSYSDQLVPVLIAEDKDMRLIVLQGPPTAEMLAHWVATRVQTDVRMASTLVVRVDVQETPTSTAIYPLNSKAVF